MEINKPLGVRGQLTSGSSTWDVDLKVVCSEDGRVRLEFDDIPADPESMELYRIAVGGEGPIASYLEFAGAAEDGSTVDSKHVYITRAGIQGSPKGLRVQLKGEAATLTVGQSMLKEEEAKRYRVRYATIGLRGDGAIRPDYNGLSIRISAPLELESYTLLAGEVVLEEEAHCELEEWLDVVDRRTANLLRVISLGQGRLIDWSIREVWIGDKLISQFFTGARTVGRGSEPAFSHLHMEPVLDLALVHMDDLDGQHNLFVVIEWLLIESVYSEVRFLTAATAFEHLLTADTEIDGSVLPKNVFRDAVRAPIEELISGSIRERLLETMEHDGEAVTAAVSELRAKLGNLNGRSFRSKLEDFLRRHDVPLCDVEVPVHELLRTRNSLVHGSEDLHDGSQPGLTVRTIMMREVLRRTILAILGYQGPFYSYVRGPEWLTFRAPPTVNA